MRLNGPSDTFAITYANDRMTDGACAQLQRIYGIYAVSRYLRVPYVHSPLKKIGYHGLHALEDNASIHDIEARYNALFTLESDVDVPHDPVVHDMDSPTTEDVEGLRDLSRSDGRFHLCRILLPYSIADQHPQIYRCVAEKSPFRKQKRPWLRVGIHVRRGELFVLESHRMLPNSYYISCAKRVAELLTRASVPFVCELYTEVPSKPFVVTPAHHWIAENRVPHEIVVSPDMNSVEEFDEIPHLQRRINVDQIETLEGLATSDVLIMSRSSFSYVAAILNPRAAVICHPFWHSPLPGWILSGEDGSFSEADFTRQLAARP